MPLLDSRRPDIPYSKGFEVTIRPHNPPLPFTKDSGCFRDESLRVNLSKNGRRMGELGQSGWCLSNPPLETSRHELYDSTRKLRVIDEIVVKDQRGAQIVRCCLDKDEAQYVAKIYDPFYYPFHLDDMIDACSDCAWKADNDYSREALSYQKISEFGIDGKFTPKFYGCWTFDLPFLVPGKQSINRPIRLILMEYVPGVSIHWLEKRGKTNEITPQNRLNIYSKVLEADTTLDYYGIIHNDVAPRNVMLVGPYKDNSLPRVYLIDFNVARIEGRQMFDKPVSPRYHHWGDLHNSFFDWVPRPLNERIHYRGWLKKVWGDENERFGGPDPHEQQGFDFNAEAEYVEPFDDPTKNHDW